MVSVQQRLHTIVLILLFVPLLALADGKVFTRAVAVPTTTPDQRALLYYSNGLEKLVIETSFIGEGTNFAWVVPLPSVPKVEAVGENFFSRLDSMFQPELIHEASILWFLFLAMGAIACAAIYGHRRKSRLTEWLIILAIVGLLLAMVLPNFVKARGHSTISPTTSVKILDRQTVGIYDTVTLSGADGSSLLKWLNTNHFYVPSNALPVLSRYVADNWVFVAATVDRENQKHNLTRPHPLAFTFKSASPIYPLQLTAVDNGDAAFELFVFGPSRAQAEHFRVEYCGKPLIPNDIALNTDDFSGRTELFAPSRPGEYRITDPEVRSYAWPAVVTTKLVGTLTPSDMNKDAEVRWTPYEPILPILYSREAAVTRAMDFGIAIAVLGGLIVQLCGFRKKQQWKTCALLAVLITATSCGLVRFSLFDTTAVKVIPGGVNAAINNLRQLDGAIAQYSIERAIKAPLTFEELSSVLPDYLKGGGKNSFTEEPLQHEASPGNITLRNSDKGTEVLWYDINANPHVLATFP